MITRSTKLFVALVLGALATMLMLTSTDLTVSPPVHPIGSFLNNIFPKTTPGAQGAWEVYNYLPTNQIPSPLKIIDLPQSNAVLVLSKIGEVWRWNLDDGNQSLVLDIKDRCFKLGDGGAVGFALHPDFFQGTGKDQMYLYYRTKPNPDEWKNEGFNVLSKFTWNSSEARFDENSEEILIQQYDRGVWHNGGGLFFDNDGYLYLSVGDEGIEDEVDVDLSTQRLDGGFFSGILRIDIDNDTTRSHTIIRQPQELATPLAGWGATFSQGYSIPDDNPWIDDSGSQLEEFYSIGLRSPYSAHYDPIKDRIWVCDVGSNQFEELNIIERGDNHQWPFAEGNLPSEKYSKPNPVIGTEKAPIYSYPREIGSTIIGGAVYRGSEFSQLEEHFIFGDYISNSITAQGENIFDPPVTLIDDIKQFGLDLPEEAGVAGVSIVSDNQILITAIGRDFTKPGRILSLRNKEIVDDPPSLLSEIGAFADLQSMEPVKGFIPYEVNVPLWSDNATKKRWIAIPNDGDFSSSDEQIKIEKWKGWKYPVGTVFMKQFDLQLDLSDGNSFKKLETRFVVVGEDNISYGLTYKWNDDGSDAVLQHTRHSDTLKISDGATALYDQVWDFPGRSDCLSCHNSSAEFVLGMNSRQMNRDAYFPEDNIIANQITYFNSLGIFSNSVARPEFYPHLSPLSDNTASLDDRIRSYLDVNCSFCHRRNGVVSSSDMDLNFDRPILVQNIINYPAQSVASGHDLIVEPGSHAESELWVRDASLGKDRMPPIASHIVDQMYVDSLAKWIDNFELEPLEENQIIVSPNPVKEYVIIQAGEGWLTPYTLKIYNTSGQPLSTYIVGSSPFYMNLNDYPSGMYILLFENGDRSESHKIIVH